MTEAKYGREIMEAKINYLLLRYLILIILACFHGQGYSQLTGIKTIPGNYATISSAVADLNIQGVGPGGVTFNVAAGYLEQSAPG